MKRETIGLFVAAGTCVMVATAALPAASPYDATRDQIQRLQRDLNILEQNVYRNGGAPPPAEAPPPAPVLAPQNEVLMQRVNDMEESLRQLTGQLEELTHQLDMLSQRNDRLQRQLDYLEMNQGTAAAQSPDALALNTPQDPALAPPPPAFAPGESTLGVLREAPAQRLPTLDTADAADEYDAAMNLLARAQYDRARDAFRSFADNHAENELAGAALYWTGDIAYSMQKDYGAAARDFAELLKKYPAAPRAPEGMLKLGLALLALGQKQEGCAALAALPAKYPNANPTILNRSRVERRTVSCG